MDIKPILEVALHSTRTQCPAGIFCSTSILVVTDHQQALENRWRWGLKTTYFSSLMEICTTMEESIWRRGWFTVVLPFRESMCIVKPKRKKKESQNLKKTSYPPTPLKINIEKICQNAALWHSALPVRREWNRRSCNYYAT